LIQGRSGLWTASLGAGFQVLKTGADKNFSAKENNMAKKSLVVFIIAALAASGIFAQEREQGQPKSFISAGAGALIGGDFGGGVEADGFKMEMPYFGGGGFLFLDATYAELSFGILAGGGKTKMEMGGDSGDTDSTITNLNIGLLGKYPFAINEKLSVFPLLGIDYQITVSKKFDGENYERNMDDSDGKPVDFSALWFKLGGGLDYDITSNVYLRGEALYGLRLANKMENDLKDAFDDMGASDPKTRLGHGLTVKLAVGYRF
jgi:opacity protein-like surface antigen